MNTDLVVNLVGMTLQLQVLRYCGEQTVERPPKAAV